jgi:hypothetical protein
VLAPQFLTIAALFRFVKMFFSETALHPNIIL